MVILLFPLTPVIGGFTVNSEKAQTPLHRLTHPEYDISGVGYKMPARNHQNPVTMYLFDCPIIS